MGFLVENKMRKYLLILFSIIALSCARPLELSSGATYYVATNGSDSNNGTSTSTPWLTLSKVSGYTFNPGDIIYFHCGDTFRGDLIIHNSGSSGAPITYGSYGTGAKPKLLGSVDISSTSAWSNVSGNIWKTSATIGTTMDDVANLIFNNEASCGVKMETQATCVTQGQWYYNPSTNYIYIYSSGNPGSYYTHIEAGGVYNEPQVITCDTKNYVTIQNLDVRYSANNGICCGFGASSNIIIEHCNVSWAGGIYVTGHTGARMGNGIGVWCNGGYAVSNVTIKYNWIHDCFDSGISPQGGATMNISTIYMYYNVIYNCGYSYEFWTDAGAVASGIYFYNNTLFNSGSWSNGQRGGGITGFHCMLWNNSGTLSNCYIRNNIMINSLYEAVCNNNNDVSAFGLDYNLYYNNQYYGAVWISGAYTYYSSLATWQAKAGEAHGVSGNPLLISTVSPYDAHISSASSPAINKGMNVGLTQDYDGVTVSSPPEIGAYEYTSGPNLATVSTSAVVGIGSTTATSGGNVTSDGGASVTAKGICWNTTGTPTLSNFFTIDGSGTGTFTSSLTGLTPSVTYYVRAYATNSQGTAYGSQVSFTAGVSISSATFMKYNNQFVNVKH